MSWTNEELANPDRLYNGHNSPFEQAVIKRLASELVLRSRVVLLPPVMRAAPRLDQSGKNDGVSEAAKSKPVSGAAQRPAKGQSALETLTPSAVGHPVGYNTETVEVYNFGSPPKADGREAGDEDITLDPGNFHDLAEPRKAPEDVEQARRRIAAATHSTYATLLAAAQGAAPLRRREFSTHPPRR